MASVQSFENCLCCAQRQALNGFNRPGTLLVPSNPGIGSPNHGSLRSSRGSMEGLWKATKPTPPKQNPNIGALGLH